MSSCSIPSSLLKSGANDLVVIGQLAEAGIPADYIHHGRVVLKGDGTLTQTVQGKDTVFTYTPPAAPPDPKDAQIAVQAAQIKDLSGKLGSASSLVSDLQARATKAETLNDSLRAQVDASLAQIASLTAENSALTAHNAALTAQIATAEASLQAAKTEAVPASEASPQATKAESAPPTEAESK